MIKKAYNEYLGRIFVAKTTFGLMTRNFPYGGSPGIIYLNDFVMIINIEPRLSKDDKGVFIQLLSNKSTGYIVLSDFNNFHAMFFK